MSFELTVREMDPPEEADDADAVAEALLSAIGFLPKGYDPKTDAATVRDSVPYRMVMECFLRRPDRGWTVGELAAALETSRPTVYRHLNKLKGLELLEHTMVRPGDEGQTKKKYRLRYGDLSKAWNFVEAQAEKTLRSYRETVDQLHELLREEGRMP